ncbi:hypothetical protein V5N11_011810 [Cardamine amara subsp. amara]|uniref:Small ribosomal subunit protein mS38 n=1 Tax=Cardamine amara subsp. amara TaxID=228776 RepID=A0ABD1AB27_CARAN
MANLMHRFFKNKSCLNSIQRLTPSLITYQKPCINFIDSVVEKPDPVSLANPVITLPRNESNQSSNQAMRFYPSFSMEFFLNPTTFQGLDLAETASLEEKEDEKEVVIYADSVKKKRKKKMNKHKYRKLRKQLGRKS